MRASFRSSDCIWMRTPLHPVHGVTVTVPSAFPPKNLNYDESYRESPYFVALSSAFNTIPGVNTSGNTTGAFERSAG